MKLALAVVGRLKSGPEYDLSADYIHRANATGRALGIHPVSLTEWHAKPGMDRDAQTALALKNIPSDCRLVTLDERGKDINSVDFARLIGRWRDQGAGQTMLVIGGADGWGAPMRARADMVLRFGSLTWPHRLVRVMAAEQIYRALSILAQTPYHRA